MITGFFLLDSPSKFSYSSHKSPNVTINAQVQQIYNTPKADKSRKNAKANASEADCFDAYPSIDRTAIGAGIFAWLSFAFQSYKTLQKSGMWWKWKRR